MCKKTVAILAILIGISLPSIGLAQVPKGIFRLSIDGDLLEFYHGSFNPGGPEDFDLTNFEVGFGNPDVGFGIGGTLADALTLGVRFTIGWGIEKMKPDVDETEKDDDDGGSTEPPSEDAGEDAAGDAVNAFTEDGITVLRWGVLPYIEYAFLRRVVRPFIVGTLGLEGETLDVYGTKSNFWDFYLAIGGGLHLFPSPYMSIDGTLLLGFSVGGGEDANYGDFTKILFRLSLLIGASGWF